MVQATALLWATAMVLVLACCAPTKPKFRRSRQTIEHSGNAHGDGATFEVNNSTFLGPREEARALCSVRTLEGNATANVTISRRLHGVLTPRELHSSIQRLEIIIHGQMQQLWETLDSIRTQLASSSTGPVTRVKYSYPDRTKFLYKYYVPSSG